MKKIIIIGGVGNGTVIASTIEDINKKEPSYEIIGFLNDSLKIGEHINGYPILGAVTRKVCEDYPDAFFIYALISPGKAEERIRKLGGLGLDRNRFPTIVHPTAVVSESSLLKKGVVLMPHVVIGPNVTVGNMTQIYANVYIGHDTVVGDNCFIANNASIGSRLVLEEGVHIGSNSSIIEKVIIGKWSLIGLGSVILKNVEPYTKMVGNPAKCIGYLK